MTRQCGTCYACCVYLGITELHKHTGQVCRHLDGTRPTQRCTIYSARPEACSTYTCMWLQGALADEHKPEVSGVLVTPYEDGLTVMVFDAVKAGKLNEPQSKISAILGILVDGVNKNIPGFEIRLVFWNAKVGMLFKDGKVTPVKLLPQKKGDYESLSFVTNGKTVGTYRTVEKPTEQET